MQELGGGEGGQGDAGGGFEHAVAVEEGPEEADVAVVAAVEFQAFEALGCVVEGGGGGGEGEGAVGDEGGGGPAGGEAPGAGYHVVGAAGRERQS